MVRRGGQCGIGRILAQVLADAIFTGADALIEHRPEAFAARMLPFEAYHVPEALLAPTTEERLHT